MSEHLNSVVVAVGHKTSGNQLHLVCLQCTGCPLEK